MSSCIHESLLGERGLCWRYKFVNFQHLDDIKAMGLDKITKGMSLDREEA